MRMRTRCFSRFGLPLAMLLVAGCNFWSGLGMHHDGVESNSTVLTADGQAALDRGDYQRAMDYFKLAVQHDPKNSEARLGYAEARIRLQGFNIVNFIQTLKNSSEQGGSGSSPNLVNPADWGCADFTSTITLFDELLGALDPITQGFTHGPVASTDVTANLNTGFLHILRAAARVQATSLTYEIQQLSKGSITDPQAQLGISQSDWDQIRNFIPDSFYWIVTPVPVLSLLSSIQSDISSGVHCLDTAASQAPSNQTMHDVVDMFKSLENQITIQLH